MFFFEDCLSPFVDALCVLKDDLTCQCMLRFLGHEYFVSKCAAAIWSAHCIEDVIPEISWQQSHQRM